MTWSIAYSKDACKFLTKQPQVKNPVFEEMQKLVRKLSGETVSIDLKKLKGHWSGYDRIRKGDVRIVLQVNSDSNTITVLKIDFRGKVYK